MFRKLKNQIQETVTEKLKTATTLSPNDNQSERSRRSSISSVTSEAASVIFPVYQTTPRKYNPPSDIESEFEADLNDSGSPNSETRKLQKLLDIYKNKFTQLKNAYNESEAEKEKIKKVLVESQDKALRRIQDLKDQTELDKKAKQDIELYYRTKLEEREKLIVVLRQQATAAVESAATQQALHQPPQSPAKSDKEEDLFSIDGNSGSTAELTELKEKCKRLELLLVKSKEVMKAQKEQINTLNAEKEKVIQSEKMVGESKDALVKLNSLLNELNDKDVFYKEQIKTLESEFNEKQVRFEQEIEQLNKQIEKLNEENKNYEFRINESNPEASNQEADAKISALDNDIANLRRLNEQLMNRKRELEQINEENKVKIGELEGKLTANEDIHKVELTEIREKIELKNDEVTKELKPYIKDLEEHIKMKESQNQTLNDEIEKLKDEITGNQEEIRKLNARIEEEVNAKDDLFNQIETFKSKAESLSSPLAQLNEDLDKERGKYHSLEQTHRNLVSLIEGKFKFESGDSAQCEVEKLIDAQHEKYLSKVNDLEECEQKCNALNAEVAELKTKLEKEFSAFNEQSSEEKERYKVLLAEYEQFKDVEYKTVNEKLDSVDAELDSVQRQYEELQTKIVALTSKNEEIKAEYEDKCQVLSSELTQLKENLMSDNEMVTQYERKFKDLDNRVNELNDEKKELMEKLSAEKEAYEKLNEEFKEHEQKSLEKSESARVKSEERIKTLEAKDEQLEQTCASLNEELTRMKESVMSDGEIIGNYEAKLKQLENERDALKESLNTEKGTVDELKRLKELDLKELNEKLDTEKEAYEKLSEEFNLFKEDEQKSFKISESTRVKLEEQIKTLEQTCVSLNEELTRMKESVMSDGEIIGNYEAKIKQLENERDALKESLNTEKDTVEELKRLKELDLKELNEKLALTKTELESSSHSNEKLNRELQESDKVRTEYEERCTVLSAELSQLKANLTSDNQIMSQYESKLKDLEDQINKLNDERNDILVNLSQEKDNYQKLVQEFDRFKETDVQELQHSLSSRTSELESTRQAHERAVSDYKTQMNTLEDENRQLKTKCDSLTNDYTQLKEDKMSDNERVSKYEEKLREANEALDRFKNIEQNLIQSESKNKELFDSHQDLLKKLSNLEHDILTKQDSIRELNEQLSSMREQLNSEKESLTRQLENSQNELKTFVEKVNKELDDYKTQNIQYESELGQVKIDNEFYLKCLNLLKDKFNFDEFLTNKNEKAFKKQLKKLFDERNELQIVKNDNEKHLFEWNEEKGKLKSELNDKDNEIYRLKDEFSRYQEDWDKKLLDNQEIINNLTDKTLKFEAQCIALGKEKEELHEEIRTLKDADSKYANNIAKIKAKMDKYKNIEEKAGQLENERKELESKVQALNEKYENTIKQHNSETDAKVQNLGNDLENCRNELSKAQNENSSLKEEIEKNSQTQVQLNEFKDKCSELHKQLLDKEKLLEKLAESELEKENQNINKIQSIEQKLMETESKFLKAEIENQKLSNQLEQLNDVKERGEQDKTLIATLESSMESMRSTHAQELKDVKEKLAEENETSLANLKQKAELKLASLKKHFENDLTSKNDELTKMNTSLENTIKSHLNEIQALKEEIDVLNVKFNDTRDGYERSLTEKLTEIETVSQLKLTVSVEQERESVRQEQEAFKLEIKNLKDENLVLKQKIDEYNDFQQNSSNTSNSISEYQLNVVKSENQELQKEVEELKSKVDDLSDENGSLKISLNELQSATQLTEKIKVLSRQLEEKTKRIQELETQHANDELIVRKTAVKQQQSSGSGGNGVAAASHYEIPNFPTTYHFGGNRSINYNSKTSSSRSALLQMTDHENITYSSFMTLESTEIDYLRQIVYAYMMGTDPVTMAKVIVAVLKFPDDEGKKIIEHEKSKQTAINWFPIAKKQ